MKRTAKLYLLAIERNRFHERITKAQLDHAKEEGAPLDVVEHLQKRLACEWRKHAQAVALLDELTPQSRQILLLRHGAEEPHSIQEIATRWNYSTVSIYKKYERAVDELAELLKEREKDGQRTADLFK